MKLVDVKLILTDLRETIFEKCVFNGVDFTYVDLRGHCLDGQTFIGVKFDKAALNEATFKGSIVKNVSFLVPSNWSKKYYCAIETVRFEGATMDKLTYAAVRGLEVDLSKVTVI